MQDQGTTPPIEKLVKVYLKIKAKRDELAKEYESQDSVLSEKQSKVKAALLDYCKEQNVDSIRTPEGLFYRTVKRNYWTSDWESMRKFIVDNKVPELLHERIHQSNMKEFLENNPDLLPPGLNVDSEYVLTIRRK
jgi:hypothetical protein